MISLRHCLSHYRNLFQALLLVSEAEKKLCPDVVRQKVIVVPNGVDLAHFAPGMGQAIPVT